jgi:hypothetical protein
MRETKAVRDLEAFERDAKRVAHAMHPGVFAGAREQDDDRDDAEREAPKERARERKDERRFQALLRKKRRMDRADRRALDMMASRGYSSDEAQAALVQAKRALVGQLIQHRYEKLKKHNARSDASIVKAALENPKNVDSLMEKLKLQCERWHRERTDNGSPRAEMVRETAKLRLAVERLEDAIERGQPVGDRLKQRKAELTAFEAKLAEPPPPKITRRDLVDRIGKALSPLERLRRDYKDAKAEIAQETRDAPRALGVERIVVTPLPKGGWKIEGGADGQRVIAGGSGDMFTMGSADGSAVPMVIRFVKVIAER